MPSAAVHICVLAFVEDRWQFFCEHEQGGRFGQSLVLAPQLSLQFLDPTAIVFCRCIRILWFAETGQRVMLPSFQLGRIHTALATPCVARGFIHRGSGGHCLQPRCGGPSLTTARPAVWIRQCL